MITYVNSSSVSGTGTSLTVTHPAGVAAGDLFVLAIGVEGRAAGSGPWVDPSGSGPGTGVLGPASGWTLIGYQAPSATGNALEVWAARYSTGTTVQANFTASYSAVMAEVCYAGNLNVADENQIVRAKSFAQWTGSNPAAPSLYAFQNELVVAIAAQQTTGAFSAPAGYTQRIDVARAGTHGNVEVAVADALTYANADSGTLAFTAATTSSPKGATMTLVVVPAPTPSGPGAAALNFRFKPA